MNLYQLALVLIDGPDGTFNCDTGARIEINSGFEVGGYAPTVVATPSAIDQPYTSGLEPRLRELVATARERRNRLGRWTAPDGRVHFDVTQVFGDQATAMSQARRNGEQYIWDWANGEALAVPQETVR